MSPATALALITVLAFAASFAIANLIRRNGDRLSLVQVPNHRSSHVKPTVSGGGLGIAVAGTAGSALLLAGAPSGLLTVTLVSAIGATMGFLDDRLDLPARYRIVAHFILVGVLLFALGPLPAPELIPGVPIVPIIIAILLVLGVWWINLFNFMDGIDGIAAMEAVFVLGAATSFILWASPGTETWGPVPTMIVVCAACLGFLLLNWPPAQIFMGDAGSNYLAFVILGVSLISIAAGTMTYAVWAILPAAFVADATVTLLRRILHGERWFAAHRLHAYQKLSRRWNGHLPSTLLYAAINVAWLYPLAYWANAQPGIEWFIAVLAYIPLVLFCWAAGAGRPENAAGAS